MTYPFSPHVLYKSNQPLIYLSLTRPRAAALFAPAPALPTPAVRLLRIPAHLLQALPRGVVDEAEAAGPEEHAAEPPADDHDHIIDFHEGQELRQFPARRVLPVVVAVYGVGPGQSGGVRWGS